MWSRIRDVLESISQSKSYKVLKDFKEIIGLGAFYLAVVASPTSQGLRVTADEVDLLAPISNLVSSDQLDLSKSASKAPASASPRLLTVKIWNHGSKQVENVEVIINGLHTVLAVAARSSSVHLEKGQPLATIAAGSDRDTHYFPNFKTLPPGHQVTFQIAAIAEPLIWRPNRIYVRSSASGTQYEWPERVSPLLWLLLAFAEPLGTVLALLLIGLGIRRLARSD